MFHITYTLTALNGSHTASSR